MTRKQLFKDLNNLCCNMNYEYDINNGGCCFVAAVLAEQLEKYNIPFKVACCFDPTHYYIKVSDRFINRDEFKRASLHEYSSKYLYNLYYCLEWNDMYNRRWNLIVKTRITSLFNKYGNNFRRRCHNSSI